ncbi:TIGR03943 family putative permease subunit [Paenibacillus hodogayensis]|uniref:TIGR03943 family putative permease subunit n=1 Tax=Paenibacillus hodogayensis TaxID=279208 RepID=A0ABV5VZF7_9BACL
MAEQRSLTVHYLFRAAIMAGFSFYILHLVKAGRLVYYIAPRMEVYVKCAAIALFVIALFQGFLGLRSFFGRTAEACDCDHMPSRSVWRNVWLYGLFLLPLAFGFLLPDKLMGSDIAAIKGMNLSGGNGAVKAGAGGSGAKAQPVAAAVPTDGAQASDLASPGQGPGTPPAAAAAKPVAPAEGGAAVNGVPVVPVAGAGAGAAGAAANDKLSELFPSDIVNGPYLALGKKLYGRDKIVVRDTGFMEVLTAVDLFLDRYIGKEMEITGFVYREPDMKPGQFVVSRLAMMCCSADSSPYGVLVESSLGQKLEKDAWVQITGKLSKTTYKDNEIMKLDATGVKTVQAPESPYVYPYFDDFEKLAD